MPTFAYSHTVNVSVILGVFLMLAGCTTLPPAFPTSSTTPSQTSQTAPAVLAPTPEKIWSEHKIRLRDIDAWSMKGKLGVKTAHKGGTANVRWERDRDKHDVNIAGPFGGMAGGRVHITEDAFGATIKDGKGNVAIGETAYDLLYQEVGWPVPFDSLKYWIVGLPIPGVWAEWQLNESGYMGWLRQAGWEIAFEDYRDRDGIPMPRKLRLTALPGTVNLTFPDGKKSDELVVKLVVSRVTVPDS